MGTLAEERNGYCNFIGLPCPIEFPPQDDMKAFLAYPYEDKIKGYISDLCKQKQLQGLNLFPWERLSDGSGIIFCKICKEILSSRAILADITYLNQNVLFELGFGIAHALEVYCINGRHIVE